MEDELPFRTPSGIPGPVGAQGARGAQGAQGPSGKSATGTAGAILISEMIDVLAESNSIYYSNNHQRLIFKDNQGRLFALTSENPIGQAAATRESIGPQAK